MPFIPFANEQGQAFDFGIVSNGTTVTAYNSTGGVVSSGPDGGAVLTAVLALLPATGGAVTFRNDGLVFPWGSVPALPKSLTNLLYITGNGATIKLSAAGPRLVDFAKVADGDTWQNIWLDNFVIDANGLTGKQAIIGNYIAGTFSSRVNFDRLTFTSIKTINVPVDPTGTIDYRNIAFFIQQPAASETQRNLTNILVRDCDFTGGSYGVGLGGGGIGTVGLTVFLDHILIENVRHDGVTVAPNGFTAANFHIGSRAFGGQDITLRHCYGRFSGDVGVEIDGVDGCLVDDVQIDDAWTTGFLHTNFNNPVNPNQQRIVFRDCRVNHLTQVNNTTWAGAFCARNQLSVALGTVEYLDCSLYKNANVLSSGQGEGINLFVAATTLRKLVVRGGHFVTESFNYTAVGAITPYMIALGLATSGTCQVDILRPGQHRLRNVDAVRDTSQPADAGDNRRREPARRGRARHRHTHDHKEHQDRELRLVGGARRHHRDPLRRNIERPVRVRCRQPLAQPACSGRVHRPRDRDRQGARAGLESNRDIQPGDRNRRHGDRLFDERRHHLYELPDAGVGCAAGRLRSVARPADDGRAD